MELVIWKKSNSLFDHFLTGFSSIDSGTPFEPVVDTSTTTANISESAKDFMVGIVCPGHRKEDFTISVQNGELTIECKQTESSNQPYLHREFKDQGFSHQINIPDGVNERKIVAQYENGVLYIVMPKKRSLWKGFKRTIRVR